jgi:O-antigen/teichoic acid export membrane protein
VRIRVFEALIKRVRSDANLSGLLRDSGILYAAGLISIGLTFAQQISTARLLGAADYGRLAAVLSSTALILLLVDFRTWEANNKLLPEFMARQASDEAARTMTWFMVLDIGFGIIGTVLLMLLAVPVARLLLRVPELDWLVRMFAVIIPFRLFSMGVPTSMIRVYDRFDWLAGKSVFYALLRLVLMSGAALLGLGLQGVLLGAIIGEIVNALLLLVMMLLLWQRENSGHRLFDLQRPAGMASTGRLIGSLWISASLKGFQREAFIPILSLVALPEQVGLFRSGLDIAQLIQRLIEPLSIAIKPKVMKLLAVDTRAAAIQFIKQSSLLLAILLWPVTLGILILGPSILPRLLGADYSGIATIVNVLIIGMAVMGNLIWMRSVLVALDAVRWEIILDFVLFVLAITGIWLLAPEYGALAAAGVMTVQYLAYCCVTLLLAIVVLRHMPEADRA